MAAKHQQACLQEVDDAKVEQHALRVGGLLWALLVQRLRRKCCSQLRPHLRTSPLSQAKPPQHPAFGSGAQQLDVGALRNLTIELTVQMPQSSAARTMLCKRCRLLAPRAQPLLLRLSPESSMAPPGSTCLQRSKASQH